MQFTFQAYRELLELLRKTGYVFVDYHSQAASRCVILRHDIDYSPEAALKLGEIERFHRVAATYFVLLTSNFYNPASRTSREAFKKLQDMGHEIGLHFDETAYPASNGSMEEQIKREASILSDILDKEVQTVSMHRPSKETLDADLQIPGMVNSYGRAFFHDYKYLSDSRRRWREPVLDIIREGSYDRLHILTHAFWYHDPEESIEKTMGDFIRAANVERYNEMEANIAELQSIIKLEEL